MAAHRSEVGELLRGRGVHLGDLSAVLAERYRDRVVLEDDAATPGVHAGGVRTAQEVEDAVARLAAAQRGSGIVAGERVLVLVDNRIDVVLQALALARIGAVAVPVNARLKAAEVAAIARAAGAVAAIGDDEVVAGLREVEGLDGLRWSATGDADPTATGCLAALAASAPGARVEAGLDGDPRATALLLTTSGTTGTPKAAALTSSGLLSAMGRLVGVPVGRRRGPRAGRDLVLAALPLTHIMGFATALGALCAGVPLVHRARFDAGEMLDLIERRRPNVLIGVPTMYADLEEAGAAERDLSSVQLFVSAADAMPLDRARRFQGFGATARIAGRGVGSATFVDVYGMVELSGAAAVRVLPASPSSALPLPAVSLVLPGISVRAVDADGHPVGHGELGELQFRGAAVLSGYEGRTDAGPGGDGWFATGDQGRLWPGGVFRIVGRDGDRLKIGGFSVFPAEVETDLREHPAVADVALVGVPDPRLGQRPVAVVVPERAGFDPGDYLTWSRDRVAGYRRPTAVVVVDDLPRGPNGKLDRRAATAIATDRPETSA